MSPLPLSPVQTVDFCSGCKGMWLEKGVLAKSCGRLQDFPGSHAPPTPGTQTAYPCFRCGIAHPLARVPYAANAPIEIDFCISCEGFFLDFREFPQVQEVLKRGVASTKTSPARIAVLERPSVRNLFSGPDLFKDLFLGGRRRRRFTLGTAIAALLGIPFLYEHAAFLSRSVRTTATVIEVNAINSECGSLRSRYSCTKFHAKVEFALRDQTKHVSTISESTRGRDRAPSSVELRPSSSIPIRFDPRDPSRIAQDTFLGGWGGVFCALFLYVLAGVVLLVVIRSSRVT